MGEIVQFLGGAAISLLKILIIFMLNNYEMRQKKKVEE
jgi:hypothetical protein